MAHFGRITPRLSRQVLPLLFMSAVLFSAAGVVQAAEDDEGATRAQEAQVDSAADTEPDNGDDQKRKNSVWNYYYLKIGFWGALGGLVYGFRDKQPRLLHLPKKDEPIDLGFVADIITGATAATALILFLGSSLGLHSTGAPNELEMNRSIGMAIIAGFAGRAMLKQLSDKLQNQVNELAVEQTKAQQRLNEAEYENLVLWGDLEIGRNDYDLALHYYKKALKIDPNDLEPQFGIALAMAYKGDQPGADPILYRNALELFDKVIAEDPSDPRYFYNRACTRNAYRNKDESVQSSITVKDVVDDLRMAIELDDTGKWREEIRGDDDLKGLEDEPGFKSLF